MDRRLATIQKISEIRPIPGADRIQVALMEGLGWECVIKKDEFNVGDLVVYCEVDSVLPDEPDFEFLRERKFRIRIIKLQKQVSMGLILPTTVLNGKMKPNDIKKDVDVTEILGVTKYLSPSEREEENIQKAAKHWTKKYIATNWLWRYKWFRNLITPPKMGDYPTWISKTDEERCISGDSILNTNLGDFTIQEICNSNENFKVKSYNVDTNKIEYKDIISKSVKKNNNDWYKIVLDDETEIILTSEHPVYLPELFCYRTVINLKENDVILLDK